MWEPCGCCRSNLGNGRRCQISIWRDYSQEPSQYSAGSSTVHLRLGSSTEWGLLQSSRESRADLAGVMQEVCVVELCSFLLCINQILLAHYDEVWPQPCLLLPYLPQLPYLLLLPYLPLIFQPLCNLKKCEISLLL